MDTSLNSNGGGGDGDGDGVSVRKYSNFNPLFWYFFQTLTVSCMLLMVLSIYYASFASSGNNIRVVCVITIAFAIIGPSFIIPKLPRIAAVALPIFELNKNIYIRVLNIFVWIVCGNLYPFPAHLLCYSLMAGVGLFKLYGDIGGSSSPRIMSFIGGFSSPRFMAVIGGDALGISGYMFSHEINYGTGRWVDSSTGCALLGLFVVIMLAHYVPPLVEPEKKKKKKMMHEIEAILIEVGSEKEKVNVVAEAPPIPGSGGTKSFLEEAV